MELDESELLFELLVPELELESVLELELESLSLLLSEFELLLLLPLLLLLLLPPPPLEAGPLEMLSVMVLPCGTRPTGSCATTVPAGKSLEVVKVDT